MDQLLTPAQAGRRLNLSQQTLIKWRKQGIGPPFLKLGYHTVRYDPTDLETWITGQGDRNEPNEK